MRFKRPRIGRRKVACLTFGLVFVLIGFGLVIEPPSGVQLRSYEIIQQIAPLRFWSLLWCSAGAAFLVGTVWRRAELPAFASGAGLCLAWGAGFAAAWLTGSAPRGWVSAAVYLAFGAFVYVIGGWPDEPPPPPSPSHEQEGGDGENR